MPTKKRKGVLSSLVDKGLDRFLTNDFKAPPSSGHRQGPSSSYGSDTSSYASSSTSSGNDDQHFDRSLPSRTARHAHNKSRSPSPVSWPYPNMSITECLLSLPNDNWVRPKHLVLRHYLGACRNYRRFAGDNAKLTIFDIPYGKDGWSTASLAKVEAALPKDLAFQRFTESDKQCILQWLAGAQRLQSLDEKAEARLRDGNPRYSGRAR